MSTALVDTYQPALMMNLSLTAATTSRSHTGGFLSTPPLRKKRDVLRNTRSPSPSVREKCILRQARPTVEVSHSTAIKSSQNFCNKHQVKISPQCISSQLKQISLSTGTSQLKSNTAITSDELASRLNTTDTKEVPELFVLDCRSFISHNLKKIIGSLNVCCSDRCSRRRLTSGKSSILDMVKGTDREKELFRNNIKSVDIVLYDDNSSEFQELPESNSTILLVGKVLQLQGANVLYLKGGLDAFQEKYDHLCSKCAKPSRVPLYSPTTPLIQEPAIDTATASKILPFLYLGNERDAANEERLKALGITHILNVTAHIPFFFEKSNSVKVTCKRLPASDSGNQNLKQYFKDACSFIDQVRHENGRVLIHCQAGVSRSATITIAYIMTHSRLSMHEAFRFVKKCREIVSPNFNFMGQLYSLEQALEDGDEQRDVDPELEIPQPGSFKSSMSFNDLRSESSAISAPPPTPSAEPMKGFSFI